MGSKPSKRQRAEAEIGDLLTQGWAQVSILLNLGRIEAATTVGLATLDLDPQFLVMAPPSGVAGARITGHEQAPSRWSLFVPQRELVVVARDAWEAHVMHRSIHHHAQTITRYTEPTWRPVNLEKWAIQDELSRGRPTLDDFPDLDV